MNSMSANALALRIKKISGGKGDASKVKMLTFYYALKAAGLFSLASFALGRMKVMDKELFSELALDLGMSDGIEDNDIENSGIEHEYLIQNKNGGENDDQSKTVIKNESKTKNKIAGKNVEKDKNNNANENEIKNVVEDENNRRSKRKR
jgi:hypothetical protein